VSSILEYQRRLRTRRNELAPISRLPNELLLVVFHFCVPRLRSTDLEFSSGLEWHHVLSFSRVCNAWRTIALSASSLWTEPLFDRPRLAMETLSWARNYPMRIMWNMQTSNKTARLDSIAALDNALEHIAHIEFLGLSAPPKHLSRILWGNRNEAPMLEHLRILNASTEPVVFGDMFVEGVPALRVLELRGCRVRKENASHIFVHLTSLTLRHCVIDLDDVIDALRDSPRLVTLVLENSAEFDNDPYTRFAEVSLPNLQCFEIIDREPKVVVKLLACMRLPSLVSIDVDLIHDDDESIDITTMNLDELQSFIQLAISCASLNHEAPSALTLCTHGLDILLVADRGDTRGRVCLRAYSNAYFWEVLDIVTKQIPVGGLLELCVSSGEDHIEPQDTQSAWARAFSKLPALQTLRLAGDAADTFSAALHSPVAPQRLPLPNLHTLSVFLVDLAVATISMDPLKIKKMSDQALNSVMLRNVLGACLSERRAAGRMLPFLLLQDCVASKKRNPAFFDRFFDDYVEHVELRDTEVEPKTHWLHRDRLEGQLVVALYRAL
jgi:hypothetical protein